MSDLKLRPLLKARNISYQIDDVELLAGIDIDILAGEVVALIGPNGSGKTTLLKTLCGEWRPSGGSIKFQDRALSDWPKKELAQRMAVLPQKSVLNFAFSSREVVGLARTPHGSGRDIDARIIDQVLDYLDATYLAGRLYTNLSGGEQQRVQLARVLAQIWDESDQPRILLLDEPSSFFDLTHQQMLIELVRNIASRNIAVLIVLHDINLALSCADRIAVIDCGRLRAFGAPAEVISPEVLQSVFSVQAKFLRDPDTGESFVALPGVPVADKSNAQKKGG